MDCKNCNTSYLSFNKHFKFFVCKNCGEVNTSLLLLRNQVPAKSDISVTGPFELHGSYFLLGEHYKITGCIQLITNVGTILLWNINRSQVGFEFLIQANGLFQLVTKEPIPMNTVKNIKLGSNYKSPFNKDSKKYRINFIERVNEAYFIGELNCIDLDFKNSIIMNTFVAPGNEALFFIVNNQEKLVYKSTYLVQNKF